jgi:hypothetical protein
MAVAVIAESASLDERAALRAEIREARAARLVNPNFVDSDASPCEAMSGDEAEGRNSPPPPLDDEDGAQEMSEGNE